jgi:predicted transcriptional regulator
MNTTAPKATTDPNNITVRLPDDLNEFVEKLAAEMCNNRAGIVRLALTKLRASVSVAEAGKAQREEAAA